jgi:hypothetical protein
MSRARALLLALVGLALPVGLALGVYVASAGSLAAVPSLVLVQPPEKIARSAPKSATSGATTTEAEGLPGKCRDPKHQLDPDCDPRSAADDDGSSGQGPGGGEDDSSGQGSSGQGSGSDDSSGHGSGGTDDSSGHGSGDDD